MGDSIEITEYAAIAIPTLCRYEHLVQCIESLQKNCYASYTDLFISVDYPPSEKYEDGYKKICEYLKAGVLGFSNVYIYYQEKNLGVFGNSIFIIDRVREKHTRMVYTEDDNFFSENYLEYANKALERYKDDPQIYAVSGYNYPMDDNIFNGNVYKNELYFAGYGYATWLEKEDALRKSLTPELIEGLYKSSKFMRSLRRKSRNQYSNFVKGYLGYTKRLVNNGVVWQMDVTYALSALSSGYKMLFPVKSKVRNLGFDGSGVNCEAMEFDKNAKITHRNNNLAIQKIDESKSFGSIIESDIKENKIDELLNNYFEIPSKELLRTDIAYICSRILGIERTRKLLHISD